MNESEFRADRIRVRRLERRSSHLGLAFLVLSGAGIYAAVGQKRFLVGLAFIVAANVLFAWGLSFHRRARDIVNKWTKELDDET